VVAKTSGQKQELRLLSPERGDNISEVQAAALRDGAVLFVCLSVCLSPEMRTQNAVFSKTKQFRAICDLSPV